MYQPRSLAGRELLRHELVHVLQQAGGEVSGFAARVVPPDHPSEARARSHSVIARQAAAIGAGTFGLQRQAIQRQPSGPGRATSTTDPTTAHTYTDEYEIGPLSPLVSAKKAMSIIKNSPNLVFPFIVQGTEGEKSIELNHFYNLLNVRVPSSKVDVNPVKVTQADDTSFTFTTLPGHFRGPGRTIKFQTLERDGKLYLQQRGSESNNIWDYILDKGASLSWWVQAQNLKAAIYGGQRFDFPGSF